MTGDRYVRTSLKDSKKLSTFCLEFLVWWKLWKNFKKNCKTISRILRQGVAMNVHKFNDVLQRRKDNVELLHPRGRVWLISKIDLFLVSFRCLFKSTRCQSAILWCKYFVSFWTATTAIPSISCFKHASSREYFGAR